jgi:hypothetical protein
MHEPAYARRSKMEVTFKKDRISVKRDGKVTEFTNLDKAWDFVEVECGIAPAEVDCAIIQMANLKHNQVCFNAVGVFCLSEQTQ